MKMSDWRGALYLYKIWNRLSSGSYFPLAVRGVEIPKKQGGTRMLGVPTVSDRIAQMVIKLMFEPVVEPHFLKDSYGYRPNKSALDAIGVTRKRCWEYDWLIEFDIKGLFDNIDHELLMKAVRHHTDDKCILLYIERWIKAPLELPDGTTKSRDSGTPQGGVIRKQWYQRRVLFFFFFFFFFLIAIRVRNLAVIPGLIIY
eukprot:TRINITY_DN5516_c0_g1_i2.p1 TRINITY_DN5516_c0_g1~~TRINITY_DN5516_c0_g1_i2.p1  ORF type:complete len:200 (-),score=12.20 TRINITY_DN5516_c0_g1_i2:559-1158(-)